MEKRVLVEVVSFFSRALSRFYSFLFFLRFPLLSAPSLIFRAKIITTIPIVEGVSRTVTREVYRATASAI